MPHPHQPPNYQHSLANLAARLHGNRHTAPLQLPSLDGLEHTQTVILLLIDGMGTAQLDSLLPGGWLASQARDTLHSVFPSTTSAAITTLLTGLPPSQHGLLAWHIWAPEAGCIATPLPLREHWRDDGDAWPAPRLAASLYSQPSALGNSDRDCYVLQPHYIADSAYSRHHGGRARHLPWQDHAQLFDTLADLSQQAGRKLVYAYLPDLDSMMHHLGTDHPRCQSLLQTVDSHCAALASRLGDDCLLLICADHGQIEVPPSQLLFLNDYPELATMLARPLSGEPRAAFCHVKAAAIPHFPALVADRLGHAVDCLPAAQLLQQQWFGPPPFHPQLHARIGNFMLLAKPGWGLLQTVADEQRPRLRGNHGGLSSAEMCIPLISYRPRAR